MAFSDDDFAKMEAAVAELRRMLEQAETLLMLARACREVENIAERAGHGQARQDVN